MSKRNAVTEYQNKAVSTQEYPFWKGDFIIERDGRVFKVGKCTKKNLNCYLNGAMTMNGLIMKELSSGFSSFNADIQESSSTEVVLASGKDQALSAKQALEQANRKLAIFQGLLNRQKNHLYSIKREYENRLETITKVVDIIELYLGVYEEIVQISEGEY